MQLKGIFSVMAVSAMLFCGNLSAQTESDSLIADTISVEIGVGDSILLGECATTGYQYIAYFRKSRIPPDSVSYDTATGIGFYRAFFTNGDFDAMTLDCKYRGRKFAVLGMEELNDKRTGLPRRILYLILDEPNAIGWVEFDQAVESGEILVE